MRLCSCSVLCFVFFPSITVVYCDDFEGLVDMVALRSTQFISW